jgi:elongation factor 3
MLKQQQIASPVKSPN